MFDSRVETSILGQDKASGKEWRIHTEQITSGATSASHGQALRGGWYLALRWALGTHDEHEIACPYDDPDLRGPRAEFWRKATGTTPGSPRPAERWLFLDEPETALDAEQLMAGLCTLVRNAEIGRLRVFCASHSPLFAAGLADDPNVQVLDFGGRTPWLEHQKAALMVARTPDRVRDIASAVVQNITADVEKERADKAAAERKRSAAAARNLPPVQKAFLIAALDTPDEALPTELPNGKRLSNDTAYALHERGLINRSRGLRSGGRLTDIGREVALFLKSKAEAKAKNPVA